MRTDSSSARVLRKHQQSCSSVLPHVCPLSKFFGNAVLRKSNPSPPPSLHTHTHALPPILAMGQHDLQSRLSNVTSAWEPFGVGLTNKLNPLARVPHRPSMESAAEGVSGNLIGAQLHAFAPTPNVLSSTTSKSTKRPMSVVVKTPRDFYHFTDIIGRKTAIR